MRPWILLMLLPITAQAAEFGVYHASGPLGHYFSVLPPDIKVAVVDIMETDIDYHRAIALEAKARGLRIVYGVHNAAFYPKSTGGWALKEDWQAQTAIYEVKARIIRDAGVLHSIYLADEPYTNGITSDAMDAVYRWWTNLGYPTMVVESWPSCRNARPPYTYFGFEPYFFDGTKWATIPDVQFGNLMYKTNANVLVIQAFNTMTAAIPPEAPQIAAGLAYLARPERVVLYLRFMWPVAPELNLKGMASLYGNPVPTPTPAPTPTPTPPPAVCPVMIFKCPTGLVCKCEGCQ